MLDLGCGAGRLINMADTEARRAILSTAAAHVAPTGRVYVEHYDPERGLTDGEGEVGPVHVALRVLERHGSRFRAEVTYRLDDERWTQEFTAEVPDERALDTELERIGLRRTAQLSADRGPMSCHTTVHRILR